MITKGSPAFTFRAGRGPGPNTSSAVMMRGHPWFGEKSLGQVSVAQSCLTLWPRGLQPARLLCPGILQARVLEWAAISFSRGSSQPRDWSQVSCIVGRFFTIWASRGAHCQGQEKGRIKLRGRTADQTWSTETQLWFIFQSLVSLVLRYWWTPGLLAQIQLLDLQC